MGDTYTLPAPAVTPTSVLSEETKDEDRLAHLVRDRERTRAAVLHGFPVEALCGKRWVPRRFQPKDRLLCVVCRDLARQMYPHVPGDD